MNATENKMVFCQRYQKELPGLSQAPLPGPFGQKILEQISEQAWKDWLEEQTKIINELNLKVFEPQAQETLKEKAHAFLFEQAQSIRKDQDPSS